MSAHLKFTVPALPSEDRRPSPGFRRHATGGKMIQRRDLLSMLAGGASALLIGCSKRLPTYRYRLTVEVDTPRGLRRGSSVIEVRTVDQVAFPGPEAGGIRSSVTGEAVAVDLPGGQTLFALLRDNTPNSEMFASRAALWAYAPRIPPDTAIASVLAQQTGIRELPKQYYPVLVHFRDIRDSASVTRVDPADLAANFGEGFAIRRITIEMTDDPVSAGIRKRLLWLSDFPEPSLKPGHSAHDFTFPAIIRFGDFRRNDP
jgi:hypothetical protein